MAEQLLRAQGVTDAELDELRRTGTLRRADDTGATIDVRVGSDGAPAGAGTAVDASAVWIDGMMSSGAAIPPEAIEKLRRFHRFIPDHVIQNLELATGQDIDGDGQIGGGGSNPAPPSAHARSHVTQATHGQTVSGAMPGQAADGPFVKERTILKPLPVAIVLLAIAGAVVFLLAR
jgi:hypothetical protein